MTYTLIGNDGNQYGPTTEADVRLWIAEGRLNGQSMAKSETDATFRQLSTFPEFAEALAARNPQPGAAPVPPTPATFVERDYDLAIGGCITSGWEAVKKNFWPAVGVSLLVGLIMGAFNQVVSLFTRPIMYEIIHQHHMTVRAGFTLGSTSIIAAPVSTVLLAGLYQYFLKLIRGGNPTIGDAFGGFGPPLGQLILLGLVQGLLIWVGCLFCVIPGIYLAVAWYLAAPLVIDKKMDFWSAMELSRKMVSKHWFTVFGLLIVYVLMILAGVLACCIGVFVALPIGIAALMYAYETIFGEARTTAA
jgi:uncharacterized membrane protein